MRESSGSGHSRRQWIADASSLEAWRKRSLNSNHVFESASWSASSRAMASSSALRRFTLPESPQHQDQPGGLERFQMRA
jgi:hypothetical protein